MFKIWRWGEWTLTRTDAGWEVTHPVHGFCGVGKTQDDALDIAREVQNGDR